MNILLIEDSDILARAFVSLLKRRGHTIDHVIGIGDATEYINACTAGERVRPDVVVTDREVVGGNAWEFVEHAVELGQLPEHVVFMTANHNIAPPAGKNFFRKGEDAKQLVDFVEAR